MSRLSNGQVDPLGLSVAEPAAPPTGRVNTSSPTAAGSPQQAMYVRLSGAVGPCTISGGRERHLDLVFHACCVARGLT